MTGTEATPKITLPFEEPVAEIDRQILSLKERDDAENYENELSELRDTRNNLLKKLYENITPWQTVKVARHPDRPQTTDYIRLICRDFRELHGDRRFGDDAAIRTGFARIGPHKVMIVGHQKGKNTEERIDCHFGCAHPEGYRKALHKMKLAEKFNIPIVAFVDTPGAYPGLKAEERGQAQAIAENLKEMSRLETPIVSIVIGEGGSGGALGIAVADRVAMLQFSWYSVISPEGCAAILWKEANEETNLAAATNLALTSRDNLRNGLIDAIIAEPLGGAQRDEQLTATNVERWIVDTLTDLSRFNPKTLVQRRYEKFANMGVTSEA
ncbi:MAG: acetyl-CoA carboxylase carboxyltransferase subunit alpha [Phycisphaerae bacterium]|jgi:acetyl-CoA carboxylase carboxyl transferase subunit alpha|nr:acetyl-CoA carboxylase carboxyltransferase subunit alpha [Phycisphaerae bacterium]|tara:strand:- start:2711 stop:3688 length:978 start_codon:yes stop_codon:yes gene_type:complete